MITLSLVPIKTLYFNNNAGSHYRTVRIRSVFSAALFPAYQYSKMLIVSERWIWDVFVLYSTVFAAISAPYAFSCATCPLVVVGL